MKIRRQTPPFLRTITAKSQVTIPTSLIQSSGWRPGDKLAVVALDEDPESFLITRVGSSPKQQDGETEAVN